MSDSGARQLNILLYQKYEFDNKTKDFTGIVLYNNTKTGSSASKDRRVTFLGDKNSNCTLEILEIRESDQGPLGLRMISGDNKWMEHIYLNISSKCTGDTAPSECMWDTAPSECTGGGGTLHPVSARGTLRPVNAHHTQFWQRQREVRVLSCLLTVKSQSLGPMAEQGAY